MFFFLDFVKPMMILIMKEAFERKIPFLTIKLKTELRKKWAMCLLYLLAKVFRELLNMMLEENRENKKITNVTNEEVLEHIGDKRMLLKKSFTEKPNGLDTSSEVTTLFMMPLKRR